MPSGVVTISSEDTFSSSSASAAEAASKDRVLADRSADGGGVEELEFLEGRFGLCLCFRGGVSVVWRLGLQFDVAIFLGSIVGLWVFCWGVFGFVEGTGLASTGFGTATMGTDGL